jgi:hypothetical protein
MVYIWTILAIRSLGYGKGYEDGDCGWIEPRGDVDGVQS